MKLNVANTVATGHRSGFTILEMMVVSVTLLILFGSLIACNMFGVAMQQRQQIWLSASDDAAQVLGKMMTDIRAGSSNYVGSWVGSSSNGNFVPFTNNTGAWQQGNALQIMGANPNGSPSTSWVVYFYDPPSSNLYRTNWNGTNTGDYRMLTANMVMTNNMYSNIFSAYMQNATGAWVPETNAGATQLILIYLAFSKLQNPQIVISPGNPVDFYEIKTTIASRHRQ